MILVNNPGSWSHIYGPLEHAPWHGSTPTDLVFPFFLFAVGNAMSFVMPRLEAAGTVAFLKKVFTRAFLIYVIGFLLNWSPFIRWDQDNIVFKALSAVRIFGVLQRIALCYLFASLIIYFFKARGAFVMGATILLGYWLLCMFLGNPADPYSLEGFWGTHVDRRLLNPGQIYKGEGVPFDPEGLISTLPAVVQVIYGYLVGQYIILKTEVTRHKEQGTSKGQDPRDKVLGTTRVQDTSDESQGTRDKGQGTSEYSESYSSRMYEMLTNLFVAGSIFIFAGLCWDMVFPINKKIWTSSYVLYTTGLATTILAIMIYLIEIKHYRGFVTRFFDVFGKNPLFIFVISGFLPRLLGLIRIFDRVDEKGNKVYVSPLGWFYEHICKPLFSNPNNGSLLYALCMIAFYWLIVYWLDRRRV